MIYQCREGDFEGDEAGALHHCSLTGHVLEHRYSYLQTTPTIIRRLED